MAVGPGAANGGHPLLDRVRREMDLSRFLAEQGERPSVIEVPEAADVGRLLTALSRASRYEFFTLHDVVASAASGEPTPTPDSAVVEHNRDMRRRGVAVREILSDGGPAFSDGSAAVAAALERDGGSVRMVPALPGTIALVDRSVAVLPLNPETRTFRLGAVLIRDPAVVSALYEVARVTWAAGRPLGSRADPPPDRLRPVLDALLDGQVDAVAARRLGLSRRTYTRRVAELMDLLGVRTRAQAGAAARRRGWTD